MSWIGLLICAEAALVDVLDHLDADLLELRQRLMLKLERDGRLVLADLVGRSLHPFLLLVGQAAPYLVADEQRGVVGLMLGERKTGAGS